jgi:hypothetical protein
MSLLSVCFFLAVTNEFRCELLLLLLPRSRKDVHEIQKTQRKVQKVNTRSNILSCPDTLHPFTMASANNFFGTDEDDSNMSADANAAEARNQQSASSPVTSGDAFNPQATGSKSDRLRDSAGAEDDQRSNNARFEPPSMSEVGGATVTGGAVWLLFGLGAGLLCLSGWYFIFGSSRPVGARARSWFSGWNANNNSSSDSYDEDGAFNSNNSNLNVSVNSIGGNEQSQQQLQQPVIFPALPALSRNQVPVGGTQVPRHQYNEFRRRASKQPSERISSVAREVEPSAAVVDNQPKATTPLIFWALDPTGTRLVKFHNPTVKTPGTIVGDLTHPAHSVAILATPTGADAIMLDANGGVEAVDLTSGAVKRVLSARTEGLLDLATNSFGDVFAINSSGGLLAFDKEHSRFAPFAPAQHLSALMVSMDFDADDNLYALGAAGQLHMLPAEELTAQSTTRAAWRRLGAMVLGTGGSLLDIQTIRIDRGDGALYAASSDGRLFSSSLEDPLVVADVGKLPSSIFAIQSATAGFARA